MAPLVQPASLANLQPKPGFAPGNKAPRRSADVDHAIRKLRRSSPDAVDYCIKVLHDEDAEPSLRVKVALAIIDKTMPSSDPRLHISADSIGTLKIQFVAPSDTQTTPLIEAEACGK